MVSSLITVRGCHSGRAIATWRVRARPGANQSSVAIPDIKRGT